MKNNLSTLLQTQENQNEIIRKQSAIIDELFVLVANYATMEELEPLLNSMESVAKNKNRIME
jgi:hypothetical protein